mmetsp:Transcript_8521/g.18160  ORF Transcript_8521/g.18160 Transcript_8521/m.18160 type:complete len:176 (-) Transcript_8521:19-546(-)
MTAVVPAVATSAEVLAGLRSYLEDEDFLLEVACWAWEHCTKFPYEPPNRWEHPLEFTRLHNEYRELFEGRCDEFLEKDGVDFKAILDEVHTELENNPGDIRALVDSLAASEDYLSFCRYMQNVRHRRDWAEGKDLQPVAADEDSETTAGASPSGRRPSGSLQQVPEEPEELDVME